MGLEGDRLKNLDGLKVEAVSEADKFSAACLHYQAAYFLVEEGVRS